MGRTFLSRLTILFLPLSIILGVILVLSTNVSFYYFLYKTSGTYGNFENLNEVKSYTENLISYFRGKNKLEEIYFSNQAILHLGEVKIIFDNLRVIFLVSTAFLVLLIAISPKKLMRDNLKKGAYLLIGVAAIILPLIFAGFEFFFRMMHFVLFDNLLWLFTEDDTLVRLFPAAFFYQFALYVIAFVVIVASSLLFVIRRTNDN